MKIFNAAQIRSIDRYTIEQEPISSEALMERAASACADFLANKISPHEQVALICGMGNNGGDGLALTRILLNRGFKAKAFLIKYTTALSKDAQLMHKRLKAEYPSQLSEVRSEPDLQGLLQSGAAVWIDALLGTGLNKTPEGLLARTIATINAHQPAKLFSIDMPSGLHPDQGSASPETIVQAKMVLTFQFPKLAFLLAENGKWVQNFDVLDIGLHPGAIASTPSNLHYTTRDLVEALLLHRSKFSHKGLYGHALLMAGSRGKSGAALIAAQACMRSGAGLLTVHSTQDTLQALLTGLPEAMGSCDGHPEHLSGIEHLERYSAIAFGPGVGLHEDSQRLLKKVIQYSKFPLLIDADGLNILSENQTWLEFLPANSILTPHVKEFDRLSQKHHSDFDRLESLNVFSKRHRCIVVLKSAHTVVAMPDGNLFFNSTGNAGLAKAGSGDGLTGILLGLLARGYSPPQAALLGVYLHGLAADRVARKASQESMLISDVIRELPDTILDLEKNKGGSFST